MKASDLFVRCLENEGVEYIFGIPGEENIDLVDALRESKIQFIPTRHEQGAAFMADMYGRLTGRPGVCISTLGPGATNLITGFADANMDHAPIIGIAGQGATTRMHKESHQILDLVNLFRPISKYSIGVRATEVIPEVVRKAFQVAVDGKPGGCFIDFPENIAKAEMNEQSPLPVVSYSPAKASEQDIEKAVDLIIKAETPLVLAGNGVIRNKACDALKDFAEKIGLPVTNTFMAKGCLPSSHKLSLSTAGLAAKDYIACGFSRADLVICAGYDIVEYHPYLWNVGEAKKIIHIDISDPEIDGKYIPDLALVGDIASSLYGVIGMYGSKCGNEGAKPARFGALHNVISEELGNHAQDTSFPVKPQKIIYDLREALAPDDIVISDVGAHKMWMARMYQAQKPNTCIISNGFASMGIGVPGAIAAKLVYPERSIVVVTGDGGFMMNSQEIETALRIGTPIVILIWNDGAYGLIEWHQLKAFGRKTSVDFGNPDFVKYAESFGAKAYRVEAAKDLLPILQQACGDNTVSVIDCPVDYSVNMEFTRRAGNLVCPI